MDGHLNKEDMKNIVEQKMKRTNKKNWKRREEQKYYFGQKDKRQRKIKWKKM